MQGFYIEECLLYDYEQVKNHIFFYKRNFKIELYCDNEFNFNLFMPNIKDL